jgi:hypothetical protein
MARMRIPKMVKNGFKSAFCFWDMFQSIEPEWKTETVWKDKTRINTIFYQFRNKHARFLATQINSLFREQILAQN